MIVSLHVKTPLSWKVICYALYEEWGQDIVTIVHLFLTAYADSIEKSQNSYIQEAKALAQQGNRDKATILMQKKKLVEKEVTFWSSSTYNCI